jgi:hypothetical protein
MLAKEEQIKAANERCETGAGRGRVCEQKERRRERESEGSMLALNQTLPFSFPFPFAQPRTSRSPALSPLDIYKKHAPGSITMNLSS